MNSEPNQDLVDYCQTSSRRTFDDEKEASAYRKQVRDKKKEWRKGALDRLCESLEI